MLEGEALDAMGDHFHAHNDYPKGTVHIAAQRLTSGAVWERTLDANNWRKKTKKALGIVAMIGGVALLVVPGGGALAVGLMVVSGAAGATSIAFEIGERVAKEGKLKFDRRLVLDLLQLASTVLAFGALSTALKEASMVAKSRYMLSMVGIDAAQGFVIAVETHDALRKIDADSAVKLAAAKTDEERKLILSERDRQVAEVIGGAVVSGGFLLVSLGGGIKQVMATTRAGKQFAVREPVKALAERSAADIQDALANQRFIHENRAVVLTEAESRFLEAQLMQQRNKAPVGDPATPTPTEQMKAPAPEPEPASKGKAEDQQAPHERTTDKMPAVDPEGKAPSEDNKAPHERATAKMPAQDPAKLPGHEPRPVSFAGKGDTIGATAAKVAPEPGYFDVAVHGDPHTFYVLHDGSWVPVKPNSVRKWLSRQPGYHGQKIRLISCEAGATGDGIAQAMANGMGVEVKAPTETLWVHDDGRITIGADPTQPSTGTWRDFAPAKPAEAAPVTPSTQPEATPRVDEPGKVGATEPHEPLPHDDGVAPALDSSKSGSTPKAEEPGAPKGEEPGSLGKNKAATAGDTASDPLPPRKNSGEFVDPELEQKYQDYRKRKKLADDHPRGRKAWKERVEWWKENSPVARGNKFNRSVAKRRLYTYNEVHFEDGTRLDSYEHDGHPERISRKATDFLAITDAEFKGYLGEIEAKYPRGKKIRSNKYPELDGKRLRGDPVLEVPLENLDPKDPKFADPALRAKLDETRARFEQLAADAGVELRYTAE